MRLLKAQDDASFSLVNFQGKELPPYAILSHTWAADGEEFTYEDLKNNTGREKIGYNKLDFCKTQAAKDNLYYFWIDTCCIDKSSSAELSEAINSMFKWYCKASKCYVYLSDVSNINSAHDSISLSGSRWFTRGWTLQELLAPQCVQFFSKEGGLIGDKHSRKEEISKITSIPIEALQDPNLSRFSVEQRMRWAEKRETTREEDRVYSLLGICNVYMPLIYGEGEDHARQRLKNLLREPGKSKAQKLSDIQDWLSAPDPSINYQKALKQRQHNTGLWFLNGERYASWKSSDASFMWLYGIPGCGKTILSSTIIESISRYCDQHSGYAVAYFYFDFNDMQKQDSERMLRSLIVQLSNQAGNIPSRLGALFSSHDNGKQPPALDELLKILRDIIQQYPQVFIVLDALDECSQRPQLMEVLTEIASWNVSNLHLLITSRREQDIKGCLEGFVSTQNTICLQRDVIDKDIQLYIHQRLSDDKKLIKWRNDAVLQQEIEDTLMNGCKGMFRWAVCQLDTLGNCLNRALLRKALKTLPSTLDKTYERILNNINEEYAEYAIRILQWLAFSEYPLSMHEIAEVVAIDVSREPEFDPEEILEDPSDALKICSSLITITKFTSQTGSDQAWGEKCIVLAHYSVKEFLLSKRIQQGPAARYSLQAAMCHSALAMACIGYLNQFQGFDAVKEEKLPDFKLARYSARFWYIHARKAGNQTAELDRVVLRFLSTEDHAFLNWIRIDDPDSRLFGSKYPQTTETVAKPLYYASLLGLDKAVKSLLAMGADVDATGGTLHNALQASIYKGHDNIVKMLLSAGADINSQDAYGSNTLLTAILCKNENIVRVLLGRGASLGPYRRLKSALHHAVDTPVCSPSLVSMLIEFGAPASTADADNMTPLHYCVKYNHTAIAAQLIDANASVDIRVRRDRHHTIGGERTVSYGLVPPAPEGVETGLTPLHYAAMTGKLAMTKLLLGYGADPNALSDDLETPLHLTLNKSRNLQECRDSLHNFKLRRTSSQTKADRMRVDVAAKVHRQFSAQESEFMQIQDALLAYSSTSLNMKDYQGNCPIHYVRYGRPNSATQVRKFVSHGADPTCCNLKQQTPLHFASRAGDYESVSALIDIGAEVGHEDDQGLNALHYAAQGGIQETIMAILETEAAKVARLGGSKDKSGKNALHHLFYRGTGDYVSTVRLLLDHGADSLAIDDSGNTPLTILARRAPSELDYDIWRCLLRVKGNESWSNSKGQNFGHLCCLQDEVNVQMLSILNECGVDLSKKDCEGKTVLHIAAIQGSLNSETMAYLVDVIGLQVTEKDDHGRSAFRYATVKRSKVFGPLATLTAEGEEPSLELMKSLLSSRYRKRKRSFSWESNESETHSFWV